jgi:hypothetical protein
MTKNNNAHQRSASDSEKVHRRDSFAVICSRRPPIAMPVPDFAGLCHACWTDCVGADSWSAPLELLIQPLWILRIAVTRMLGPAGLLVGYPSALDARVNSCPFVIRERNMADTTRYELGVPNVVDRATVFLLSACFSHVVQQQQSDMSRACSPTQLPAPISE